MGIGTTGFHNTVGRAWLLLRRYLSIAWWFVTAIRPSGLPFRDHPRRGWGLIHWYRSGCSKSHVGTRLAGSVGLLADSVTNA